MTQYQVTAVHVTAHAYLEGLFAKQLRVLAVVQAADDLVGELGEHVQHLPVLRGELSTLVDDLFGGQKNGKSENRRVEVAGRVGVEQTLGVHEKYSNLRAAAHTQRISAATLHRQVVLDVP